MILFLFIEKIIAIIQLYSIQKLFNDHFFSKKAISPRKDKIAFECILVYLFVF